MRFTYVSLRGAVDLSFSGRGNSVTVNDERETGNTVSERVSVC